MSVSGNKAVVSSAVRLPPIQQAIGGLVVLGALVMAVVMSETEENLAFLWLLAVAGGFTLQRSRFCFASAFRDIFLFGSARTMKGIILGLGVVTTGFAIIMHDMIPNPSFGFLPDQAHVLPVGLSTVVGGLLFGFGMVVAGGCVSGSLYRMAEGYVASWVSVGGIIIGLGLLWQTWNWWWTNVISHEPSIWLPSVLNLGYGGGVAVTFMGLLGVFLLVLWWESRAGLFMPTLSRPENPEVSMGQKLAGLRQIVFIRGWSAAVGGAVLGGIVVLMYMTHMPWGVTGELARLSNTAMSFFNFAAPPPLGLDSMGGCTGQGAGGGLFTHSFAVTVGLLPGSLAAALFAGEFKLRFPKNPTRYFQALGGGVLMGYGAGLAIGCTIGAFFSSIPSLSVSGWVFAVALAGGAFLGVQAIKRIP